MIRRKFAHGLRSGSVLLEYVLVVWCFLAPVVWFWSKIFVPGEGYTENGAYRQRLVGYRYRHTMKVEFDSDNDRLGKVLYALANSELQPEFNISYTVKDREAAKNELLGKAVADAKEKAAVLTQAAGVILKDIQTIDYSWGELNMETRPMNRMLAAKAVSADSAEESYAIDMEPDDISVSDTVTVVWEIV